MEAAGARYAARHGMTMDELRAEVRNPLRTCAGPDCNATFRVYDDRKRYCSDTCKAAAHKVRNGAES
jgi:hypothetical protein